MGDNEQTNWSSSYWFQYSHDTTYQYSKLVINNMTALKLCLQGGC